MKDIDTLLKEVKKIHMIGIGGSGMCPIAEILHKEGYELTGSDNNESDPLQRVRNMGVDVKMGHSPDNIGDAEMVIHTAALLKDNVELLAQPFNVNYGREYRIAVLFFHGAIVTYGVTLFYGSAALYDARLKKHRLNQGCFTRSRCTQKGDVFNLR